MILFFRNKT
ncbi:hypothetical protein RDI58_000432 [Solanum bulbocastanum]|uniref:Uncharacterized protein n=1 Tax=Solanum bulbocastanum TaxID=147425 RepID=A0AAN8YP30_SOLBU